MNEKYSKDYTMIYNLIIRTDKLDTYQKSCICNILSNDENFRISLNLLAKRIPCSQRKLQQIIKGLKDVYILTVNKVKSINGDWDSNKYLVNIDNLFKYIGVENNMPNVENEVPNGRECNAQQVENNMLTKNTNKNTNIENIYSSNDYEEIWKAYPNKKGKAKSITYINKILKSISKEQLLRCIDRYKKDVEYQRANGFKTLAYKNGSTFFNVGYIDYLDENYQENNKDVEEVNNVQVVSIEELIGGRV